VDQEFNNYTFKLLRICVVTAVLLIAPGQAATVTPATQMAPQIDAQRAPTTND